MCIFLFIKHTDFNTPLQTQNQLPYFKVTHFSDNLVLIPNFSINETYGQIFNITRKFKCLSFSFVVYVMTLNQ